MDTSRRRRLTARSGTLARGSWERCVVGGRDCRRGIAQASRQFVGACISGGAVNAARELGNDLAGRLLLASGPILGGLEHVVGDVQRGSHASDADASRIKIQARDQMGVSISALPRAGCAPR